MIFFNKANLYLFLGYYPKDGYNLNSVNFVLNEAISDPKLAGIVTQRHDGISRAIHKFATANGCHSFLEKRFNTQKGASRIKPDVELHFKSNTPPLTIDVTIFHPFAKITLKPCTMHARISLYNFI